MPTTTYTQPTTAAWTAIDWPFAASWARAKYVALAGAVVVALAFRLSALSAYGLSEDEINKLHAVEQYRAGRFTANAEHPMLMKLAMWGSVTVSDAWSATVPAGLEIPLETALRAPNAVAGAATTAALFGVADLLFGGPVAIVAAAIWAFDVNAIAINRIGKEDTFLLLFFLLAIFCYERAKRAGADDLAAARRWYTVSGASFGLMLASKYMPHYLGIYAIFNLITDPEPGANRPSAAVGLAAGIGWLLRKGWLTIATRRTVAAAAIVVFAAGLASAPQAAAPFYSLFQNGVGARIDPRGSAFPEQTYDYGVREAAALIASAASPSAVVVTDAPAVASLYLQRDGRPDITVRGLSSHGVAGAVETWVLTQDEHVTFENDLVVERLRATRQPWTQIRMGDLVALQVFRIPEMKRCNASSS